MEGTLIPVFSIALMLVVCLLIWWVWSDDSQIVNVADLKSRLLESNIVSNGKIEASKEYELCAPLTGSCQRFCHRKEQ
jgi:hypothetical protein